MFMLFFFRVIILDRNFDDVWFHVIFVGYLHEFVDFVRDLNFFDHRHFNILDDCVFLNVMMMNGVNVLGNFFVFDLTLKMEKKMLKFL